MSSFSERLTSERNRLGFSQADFAKSGGVARSAQANYESGARSPDADTLAAWAAAGADVRYLVTGVRSGEVDGTLLGMCEAALRARCEQLRPGMDVSGAVRLSALSKTYNAVLPHLSPDADVPHEVREAADRYIGFVDDPGDPGLLPRALFRAPPKSRSEGATSISADRGAQVAGRDVNIGSGSRQRGPKT